MASVDSLMKDAGASIYYDDGFRSCLEDHMTYLRTHKDTGVIQVAPIEAIRYKFDLAGLLISKNIPVYLHWLVMRMNRFNSPTDMTEGVASLLIPDPKEISKIAQAYNTTNVISG